MFAPAFVLLFAVASAVFFGASFGYLVSEMATGSAKDQAREIYGHVVSTIEFAIIIGWIWAIYVSYRSNSSINRPMQVMCGATAVAQIAILLETIVTIGLYLPKAQANIFIAHAFIGFLLAIYIGIFMRRKSAARAD